MRAIPLLALLSLAAAPAAAQGIAIPIRCEGTCPADRPLSESLVIDTVSAWANLENGRAVTFVTHRIRNTSAGTVRAALFFPLPAGAVISSVTVYDGVRVEQYGDWTSPAESRWIADGIVRDRPESALRAYAGTELVHMPVHAIPPHGSRGVQVTYTQPLTVQVGVYTYRYPLSAGAGAAHPVHLAIGATVKTETGFRDLTSPSHTVDVEWGEEMGPCPPEARCGSMNVPSRRVKVVRFTATPGDRSRDFEIVYTPSDAADGAVERRRGALPQG